MSQEGTSNRPSPTTVTTRQGRRSNSETQFPGKLHDLMTFVKKHGLESIIAWVRNGTAIMIYNPSRLTDILPMFFGQTKYRSFRRQLNMWHFERMSTGPDQGAFIHPFFIEGRKSLCAYMSRHVDPNEYQPVPLSRDFPMPTSDDTTSAILRPTRQEVLAIGTSTDVGTLVSTSGTTPTSTRSSTEKPVRVDLNKNAFSTTQGKESSSCEPNNGVGSATKAKSSPTLLPMTKDEDSSSSSSSSDSSILTTTLKSLISLQHHGDKESAFTSSPNSTHHSDNQLIPKSMLEAICPGLSIPASPETVASIFRELNEFDI